MYFKCKSGCSRNQSAGVLNGNEGQSTSALNYDAMHWMIFGVLTTLQTVGLSLMAFGKTSAVVLRYVVFEI
jgi:hypothetical protein